MFYSGESSLSHQVTTWCSAPVSSNAIQCNISAIALPWWHFWWSVSGGIVRNTQKPWDTFSKSYQKCLLLFLWHKSRWKKTARIISIKVFFMWNRWGETSFAWIVCWNISSTCFHIWRPSDLFSFLNQMLIVFSLNLWRKKLSNFFFSLN